MSDRSAPPESLDVAIYPVIDCLIEGQRGLRTIGESIHDPLLKQYFLEESEARAKYRNSLESILHHHAVHDIEEGALSAAINRVWGKLKSKLDGRDQSLLAIAEHDQLAATRAYAQALEQDLPFPVRQTLLAQAACIELFHEYVHAVRKINKAPAGN